MNIIYLRDCLKFIFNTLENFYNSITNFDDVEFFLILDNSLLNLQTWIDQLQEIIEDEDEEIRPANWTDEYFYVEFSLKQCSSWYFLLLTLKENLEKVHQFESIDDLSDFNKLIKCVTLVDKLLVFFQDKLNFFENDLNLEDE